MTRPAWLDRSYSQVLSLLGHCAIRWRLTIPCCAIERIGSKLGIDWAITINIGCQPVPIIADRARVVGAETTLQLVYLRNILARDTERGIKRLLCSVRALSQVRVLGGVRETCSLVLDRMSLEFKFHGGRSSFSQPCCS